MITKEHSIKPGDVAFARMKIWGWDIHNMMYIVLYKGDGPLLCLRHQWQNEHTFFYSGLNVTVAVSERFVDVISRKKNR